MTGHWLSTARRVLLVVFVTASARGAEAPPPARSPIDFDRQVRPVLSNNCFQCHGPDEEVRESGLRLDLRDAALQPAESGKPAIVPGKPDESPLVKRIVSTKKGFQMPPPQSNKKLSEAEKELLKQWIAAGAGYTQHWAFTTPVRPALPPLRNASWARNPIDRFILARLEAEGLQPAAEADRTTLIRRLTLDLTGLPPTPAEVAAFLADARPNAYDVLVDRLLRSPRFGERMALDWLDAARFADTHGYHIDSARDMTRWRDWVIDAFNANLPFDQFTIEQLAGDLLPNATLAQKVASGFNRNNMITYEGGAIPEEYLTAYIIDRVNTTGTVWLGLTVGCTQCHDHKFDPMTQKEFYQLYAFFNNVPENGLDGRQGNAAPAIPAPSTAQQERLDQLAEAIRSQERKLEGPWPEADAGQAAWEKSAADAGLVAWTVLEPSAMKSKGRAKLATRADKAIDATGPNPASDVYTITAPAVLAEITAVRLEALPDDRLAGHGPGRSENGNIVLTDLRLEVGGKPVTLKSASADFSQQGYPVAQAIDDQPSTGWAIYPEVGKPHSAVFEADRPIPTDKARVTVTLAFQSGFAQHQLGRFRLSVTDAKAPHGKSALPAPIAAIVNTPAEQRNDAQQRDIRRYYRQNVAAATQTARDELARLRKEQDDLNRQIPTAMVMQDMPRPRDTFLLVRGQYDKHGEKVSADIPAFLPPLPKNAPRNRLTLARWLVAPEHPLTSRVTVNRLWQTFFGTGLVKTAEDFGSQGEPPSHLGLLDWLAVEFATPGTDGKPAWDVKALVRLIVTSATYRQASAVTPELVAKDPENRLLARGARFRLPAEFVRDQALAVAGLLDGRIGGASVSPYQPPGLWEELMSRADGANFTAQTYVQSHGRDLYRRTMYTFWKRTSPPPSLTTFDAPDRETCTVRRARTNTPLQALVLLNDPTYVEASRKLAERMMTEGGRTPEERIAFAFRLATARLPNEAETRVLKTIFTSELATYRHDPAAALKLLKVGESPRNEALDPAELAAWSTVAGVILNLDETVTKG